MSLFKKKPLELQANSGSSSKNRENNPYLNARAEWLERYGSYISRARNWQLCAFVCLFITLASIIGNVVQASQYKIVPYVVEVDKLGRVQATGRAESVSSTPQRLIQAEITTFISNWRTVTPDLDLQRKMIDRLSHFMAGAAKGEIRQWFAANNPYERAKEGKIVQIEIKGLPLAVSKDSWRVEWRETTRNHTGAILEQVAYEATVTIAIEPPTDDATIIANPGGIYITAISASTVFAASQQGQQRQQGQQGQQQNEKPNSGRQE